jgi:hypothetical protein
MKTIYVLLAFLFSILSFAQRQTQYAIVDKQMSEIPLRLTYSTDAIAHYINARFQTEDEKIRAVFYWTASNISYDLDKLSDLNNKETSENNSEKILNSKKGVCSDYTKIFKEIANKVGVKTEIISGYTKQNGVVVAISHAWCASKIDNLWYIFDPTWGSGHVNNGKFVTSFDDHYFKVNPNKIITSHMPYDYMWQFLNYPISNQEFYDGRTASANSKKRFDFEAEISNYNTLSGIEQVSSSSVRIRKNGVVNAMIVEQLSYNKSKIEYLKQIKVSSNFKTVVLLYNDGISDLNRFINYRNKQFRPMTSDKELKALIESPKNKFRRCQEMLTSFEGIEESNEASINGIKQSLAESIGQAEEYAAFVNAYLSKSKVMRERMFYKTRPL